MNLEEISDEEQIIDKQMQDEEEAKQLKQMETIEMLNKARAQGDIILNVHELDLSPVKKTTAPEFRGKYISMISTINSTCLINLLSALLQKEFKEDQIDDSP